MIARLARLLLLCIGCSLPGNLAAHALDPGYLELQPLGGEDWRVVWRKPQVQGAPMPIEAVLPENCADRRAPDPVFDGRAFTSAWVTRCDGGLPGGVILIEGLGDTRTDVLVRFATEPEAAVQTRRLTPDDVQFQVPERQTAWGVLGSYFALGFDHILEGFDHLLFVLTLLLLVRGTRLIIGAITAFTIAHSLTLGAVTLGLFSVPPPPVEAVVALSIAVLAAELAQPEGKGLRLSERYPWTIAFCFGLLHGLGFASALREIGLPESDVPLALLSFNLGVEAGQLLFVFFVLTLGYILQRVLKLKPGVFKPGSRPVIAAAYVIGTIATYWMIERIAGFAT